jgi:transcriptional regulator with XRE-family HTH domain
MGVEGFGKRLGEARRRKGLRDGSDYRASDLARDMETTDATISRWENDESLPKTLWDVERLATILGCDPGWLAFGDDGGPRTMRPDEGTVVPRPAKEA